MRNTLILVLAGGSYMGSIVKAMVYFMFFPLILCWWVIKLFFKMISAFFKGIFTILTIATLSDLLD